MSRFIAIPVSQGDAFYLERGDFSVLVDGGRRRAGFASMFRRFTGRDSVKVLLCTHNDADHANGTLGFLEEGLQCDEVWLPGRWLSALPYVLRPPAEVSLELARDIAREKHLLSEADDRRWERSPIEAFAERLARDVTDTYEQAGSELTADGWPEQHIALLEQAEPGERPSHLFLRWGLAGWYLHMHDFHGRSGVRGVQLLWSAIDAAARIRAIASEAFHRGVPVRWFELGRPTASCGEPELRPLNSREIACLHPPTTTLLAWLALTVLNRESLVFWSRSAPDDCGVLFTADSDLSGAVLPPGLDHAIVTAPHHGSEANAAAYPAVHLAAGAGSPSISWVRSDGRFRNRPGSSYLGLESDRFCTLCRNAASGFTPKHAVEFISRGGAWRAHPATKQCTCV